MITNILLFVLVPLVNEMCLGGVLSIIRSAQLIVIKGSCAAESTLLSMAYGIWHDGVGGVPEWLRFLTLSNSTAFSRGGTSYGCREMSSTGRWLRESSTVKKRMTKHTWHFRNILVT